MRRRSCADKASVDGRLPRTTLTCRRSKRLRPSKALTLLYRDSDSSLNSRGSRRAAETPAAALVEASGIARQARGESGPRAPTPRSPLEPSVRSRPHQTRAVGRVRLRRPARQSAAAKHAGVTVARGPGGCMGRQGGTAYIGQILNNARTNCRRGRSGLPDGVGHPQDGRVRREAAPLPRTARRRQQALFVLPGSISSSLRRGQRIRNLRPPNRDSIPSNDIRDYKMVVFGCNWKRTAKKPRRLGRTCRCAGAGGDGASTPVTSISGLMVAIVPINDTSCLRPN